MSRKDRNCHHCGMPVDRPRSELDHRRLFAVIRAAFDQWPEAHTFQPDDAEHLRAWLTCKAGYRETTPVMLPEDASDHMRMLFRIGIEAALVGDKAAAFVVPYAHGVAVVRPKSISFSTLGQREFAAVRTAIEEVIEAEIGVTADELLRGAQAA